MLNRLQRLDSQSSVSRLQAYLPQVNSLRAIAETKEELAVIEDNFLQWFLQSDNLIFGDSVVGGLPKVHDFVNELRSWSTDYTDAQVELDNLIERYLKYSNAKQLELKSLESLFKRLLQKRAAINLWSGKKPKSVESTSFQTYDGLSSKVLSVPELSFDFQQGIALLPVLGETQVGLVSARILSGSNGQPGNSDINVSQEDNNPLYMLDTNESNVFEYERLDAGPVKLVIALDFATNSIVNKLVFEFNDTVDSNGIVIENVEFVTPTGFKSLKELSGTIDLDTWKLSSYASTNVYVFSFLPVEASSVVISISGNKSTYIETATKVYRNRYALALKHIKLLSVTYDSVGGVGSAGFNTGSAQIVLPVGYLWPLDTTLYDKVYEYSFNESGTWNTSDLNITDSAIQSTVYLPAANTFYQWRLKLSRKNDAFANVTSYTEASTLVPQTHISLTSVSPYTSPATIPLLEVPKEGKVVALQPQLLQVTDDVASRYVLGVTTGMLQKIKLPVNVFTSYDFVDDYSEFGVTCTVTVGGQRIEVNQISDSPSSGDISLSSDGSHLMVNQETAGLEIYFTLPGERLNLTQKPDGYYHRCRNTLDPDKQKIRVFRDPLASISGGKFVSPGKKFLRLDHSNINYESISMVDTATGLSTGTKRATYGALASPGDYYVDLIKGILFLHTPKTAAQQHRLKYTADSLEELAESDFDIVIEEGIPTGIRISSDAFIARTVTESLDGERPYPGAVKDISRREIRTGELIEIDDEIGAPGHRLSYDSVVPNTISTIVGPLLSNGLSPIEIPYIDGTSEFTGLAQSDSEVTVYLQAAASGVVTFYLAARSLWKPTWGITFGDSAVFDSAASVSAGAVSSDGVGAWHVSSAGLVTVNVGANSFLAPGISINYFYSNPDFDPTNKFSVNYDYGSLHSQVGFNPDAKISYQVARYKMWYDVASVLTDATYDSASKLFSVKTENMFPINNLLRILWNVAGTEPTLQPLANYFSPLLYQQGHILQ
jgi:hypothetical protein